MTETSKKDYPFISTLAPFVIGGISGVTATLAQHPLDTLKVQMQVVSEQRGKTGHYQRVSQVAVIQAIY